MFVGGFRALIVSTAVAAVALPSMASAFAVHPAGASHKHVFKDALKAKDAIKTQANGNGNGPAAQAEEKAKAFIGTERRESDERRAEKEAKKRTAKKTGWTPAQNARRTAVPARMVPLPASTFSKSELAPENSVRPKRRSRI